ncbi:radical SAM family heme chaperone HemW [bacterium]|nr:radical SAM family heme chaperone HemW [bacterium]
MNIGLLGDRIHPALYVHIPFCSRRCPYCAFYTIVPETGDESRFVEAVVTELTMYHDAYGRLELASVFWGGGTPSLLSPDSIDRIWSAIEICFHVKPTIEKTMEMNPESVTPGRLRVMSDHHVNRVSLGVQSFNKSELNVLGRLHTLSHVPQAVEWVKDAGIRNFNLDFIYALPGQSVNAVDASLEEALELAPTHVSTYALSIEPGTPFQKAGVRSADERVELGQYNRIRRRLSRQGFEHYEVSAFARPGFRSAHNLAYWHYRPYIGVGPSASSYFEAQVYRQVSSLERYIQSPIPPILSGKGELLSSSELWANYLVANLRRLDGVLYSEIKRDTGVDAWEKYKQVIMNLTNGGFLRRRADRIQVTVKGLHVLNSVIEAFL